MAVGLVLAVHLIMLKLAWKFIPSYVLFSGLIRLQRMCTPSEFRKQPNQVIYFTVFDMKPISLVNSLRPIHFFFLVDFEDRPRKTKRINSKDIFFYSLFCSYSLGVYMCVVFLSYSQQSLNT